MTRRQWYTVIFGSACFGAVLAFLLSLPGNEERGRFIRARRSLTLGKTSSQIQADFGSPPVCRWHYKTSEIWYYRSPGVFVRSPEHLNLKDGVAGSLKALPDVYGYLQLAFDSTGCLCAYTLIGESFDVTYEGGSVRGSHLSEIHDPLLLMRLEGDTAIHAQSGSRSLNQKTESTPP